jgi:hypothetical protein
MICYDLSTGRLKAGQTSSVCKCMDFAGCNDYGGKP